MLNIMACEEKISSISVFLNYLVVKWKFFSSTKKKKKSKNLVLSNKTDLRQI